MRNYHVCRDCEFQTEMCDSYCEVLAEWQDNEDEMRYEKWRDAGLEDAHESETR